VVVLPITSETIDAVEKINLASFPIKFPRGVYKTIATSKDGISFVARYRGRPVGAVCASIEDLSETKQTISILTLATLAAFRGKGVGSRLMERVLECAEDMPNVVEVSLHVQVSNTDAIRFYKTRFGFQQREKILNFYNRVNPPHCYKFLKPIR